MTKKKRQRQRLIIIFSCIVLAIVFAVAFSLTHLRENQPVHYVTASQLNQTTFHHSGWYYDGRDWAYVRHRRKVTGSLTINGVHYRFNHNGLQKLPYKVNYQYELSPNQGSNQQAYSTYIILHDVGSDSTGAQAASYMKRTANYNQAYANFVVGDGGTVYQIKNPGTISWGAGIEANNNAPVQIELAHANNDATFQADYQAYVALARDMAGKYNIPLTLDQGNRGTRGIKSHLWVTQHLWGDHQDPYEYLQKFGVTKSRLESDLE